MHFLIYTFSMPSCTDFPFFLTFFLLSPLQNFIYGSLENCFRKEQKTSVLTEIREHLCYKFYYIMLKPFKKSF